MCNLFSLQSSADEVAAHFGVAPPVSVGVPSETIRGSDGLVVRETRGRRVLQTLSWGFPRLTREMREKGEAPTRVNLTADLTNPMWSDVARDARYRCIIPLTRFGEPDGPKGKMTRSWYRVVDEPLFAWAGFARNTDAFGPVFSGMTTDSNEAVSPLNPRMPVLLRPDDYERWLHGTIQDVIAFQFREVPAERLILERTDELWRGGATRTPEPALL
jgi:putative SOS response-associated peptidase YedK